MKIPKLSPSQLQMTWQYAAQCDALITSEDWLRSFWYEQHWSDGIAMAKYDNGAGDHVIALFSVDGKVVLKGFDHESEVSPYARDEYGIWPGIYEGMPQEFLRLIQDEAIESELVTFCCWSTDGKSWETGTALLPVGIDDGSDWLLDMVQMDAEEFIEWAKSYYEDNFERIGEDGIFKEFKVRYKPASQGD